MEGKGEEGGRSGEADETDVSEDELLKAGEAGEAERSDDEESERVGV